MKIFWENEVIYDTKSRSKIKELHFVENLLVFISNNKGKIHFDNVMAGKDQIFEAVSGDTVWRQVDGIRSKEDLLYHHEIGKPKRWTQLNYNISRYYFNIIAAELKKEFNKNNAFQYLLDPCYHDVDLYLGLSKTAKCGYSFNECEPFKIYEDVNQIDINSFYSSIMRTKKFPHSFKKIPTSYFGECCKNKAYFFGYFRIKINSYDCFLAKMGDYDGYNKTIEGYFNNIDFSFLKLLCGIKSVDVKELWFCDKWGYLPEGIIKAIDYCYSKKEELSNPNKPERIKYKLALERFYGNCLKERFYKTSKVWNEEKQELETVNNKFEFTVEFRERAFKGYFHYAWGVWVCSYARYELLRCKKELGSNCLYGDVDSLKFIGDGHFNFSSSLGAWKNEGKLKSFRAIDLKWYIGEYDLKDTSNKNRNEKLKIACSGANKTIMEEWLNNCEDPISSFSKTSFPENIKPYKTLVQHEDGTFGFVYRGGAIEENNIVFNNTVMIGCAGGGKTTTLLNKVRDCRKENPDDLIVVLSFTKKSAKELEDRFKEDKTKIIFSTIDSLVHELCFNKVKSTLFEEKRIFATDVLRSDDKVLPPCHLFVDEFQDLDFSKFNFISAIPTLSRFYIGDPNQSIYGYDKAMNFFGLLVNYNVEKINTNYRCGQLINDYGEGFLPEERQPHANCANKDGEVVIKKALSYEVIKNSDIILTRTNRQIKLIKEKFPFIEEEKLMTIHQSKGLTFDRVAVVGIKRILSNVEEQNIAYVACTRARKKLIVIEDKELI